MHHFLYTLPLPAAVKPLFSGFKIHGNFTTLDLIAASTNALNGALLARRPDHYRSPGRGLGRDLALLSHGHLRASADSLGMRGYRDLRFVAEKRRQRAIASGTTSRPWARGPTPASATKRACGPDRRRPAPTCALLARSAPSGLARSTGRERTVGGRIRCESARSLLAGILAAAGVAGRGGVGDNARYERTLCDRGLVDSHLLRPTRR
jgi:hypothetical protein